MRSYSPSTRGCLWHQSTDWVYNPPHPRDCCRAGFDVDTVSEVAVVKYTADGADRIPMDCVIIRVIREENAVVLIGRDDVFGGRIRGPEGDGPSRLADRNGARTDRIERRPADQHSIDRILEIVSVDHDAVLEISEIIARGVRADIISLYQIMRRRLLESVVVVVEDRGIGIE